MQECVIRKKHINFKFIFIGVYCVAFLTYIIYGLQFAEATNYEINAKLEIPSIGLATDVTPLTLEENKLDTPDSIVGSYSSFPSKTLLIGHTTGVFHALNRIAVGDQITYQDNKYDVIDYYVALKSDINMTDLLSATDKDTLVLMTCAGTLYEGGDASHRLIVTAIKE